MTLKEIAKEAGVSVSTVSRVINQENTKAASPKVQARIWEIIRRTGYSPNKTARNLKLGQSAELRDPDPKSIACVYARTHTDMSDPFFSQIVKALELEAIKSRYFTLADLKLLLSLPSFPLTVLLFSAVTTSGLLLWSAISARMLSTPA